MRFRRILFSSALVLSAAFALGLVSCAPAVPNRSVGIGSSALECRAIFKQNDELTRGDGSISEKLARHPCWNQSLEEHTEFDLITAEFDDQGWLQGTAQPTLPRPDHLDDVIKKLAQIYDENQQNGISIVLYVHGWHHDARPADPDVAHFRKFLADIKAAENGRTLSDESLTKAGRAYSEPQERAKGPRVVGIYVGWRGESVDFPGLKYLTFWERKDTAALVAAGSIRELFQQLDFVRDCGRTALDWNDMRKRLTPEERFKEGKVGHRNVRMLTIGHSFGGLVTWRGMSSEFIASAVRASREDYVSRVGDLVVIVNPAFEGARYEAMHVAGRRILDLKDNQLPTVIIATSRADLATRYAFPIARQLNTILERTPGPEGDATVLAVGHNPRYRTHFLSKCDSATNPQCIQACQPSAQLSQTAETAQSKDQTAILGEIQHMQRLGQQGFQDKKTYLCSALELETDGDPQPRHNPFWVVSTTGDIMSGHNDIFNPLFVSFFRQMYLGITLARLKNPATTRCTR